ncbi:MAG: AAA family ATPase [Cyanobacteria bacterium SBLK]|nr:AAA family ATPase [Cyanobacteria bacterium SBLK]
MTALNLAGYQETASIYSGIRTLVYRAIRIRDRHPVIIKILRNPHPHFNELVQFRNQYAIARHLQHLGIVHPLALERYGNGYALIMPDEGAIALSDYWRQSMPNPGDLLVLAVQIADILHYLGRQRIVHKDIKPSNILIHPETRQVKLIDFSISSLLPKERQQLANPNILEGTLAYISPEQTGRMNRGIDYRTDFYSLGVTLYELLTGILPFSSSDPMELVHCHIAQTPLSPLIFPDTEGNKHPEAIANIILKLMAKNAEDRYQSALGLKYDLEQCWQRWQAGGEIAAFELGTRDLCDRFLIPERLYGRETEVATLLAAFERVSGGGAGEASGASGSDFDFAQSEGEAEMILVAGFSGMGKTAVLNEVHKPITRQRGYFIKGKYDQFNRNIPFSAFLQAFRDLIFQLLSESDARLARWKERILQAVGENGRVLIEAIPELEEIIGRQPPIPELSGTERQNRFNFLFHAFIEIFASPQHPLVLFLDDLQWVDSASLQLIKLLLDGQNSLLLLGAYRDNEVSPVHPFMLAVEELKKAGKTVNTIALKPLDFTDLNRFVADTLHCSIERSRPLAEAIDRKTQGNPFFTTQFLGTLYEENYLTFNYERGYWECDIVQISDLSLTSDVVELIARKLRKLPPIVQKILKLAACIGNPFALETIAIVAEESETKTANLLWNALQAGLILPQSEIYKFYIDREEIETDITLGDRIFRKFNNTNYLSYRFLHDRVQQAAYSLIPENRKASLHYRIGQLLLQKISQEVREERIFEIVGQLNFGIAFITEQNERDKLAKLNLLACRKARLGTAYEAVRQYAKIGWELLGANAWQRAHAIALEFHEFLAEATFVLGDWEAMDRWLDTVLNCGKTLLEKIKVYIIKIQALTAQKKFLEAIACGREVLHQLNITLPEPVTPTILEQEIAEIQNLIGDRDFEELLHLPEMVDPEILAIMNIVARMIPVCYFTSSPLFPLLGILQVKLSLQYGNGPISSTGYADYGIFLLNFKKEIATSNKFGQLAYQLASLARDKNIPSVTFVPVGLFLHHHQYHLRETLPIFQVGMQAALEVGKFEYVGHHSQGFCVNAYWCGQPLGELKTQIQTYRERLIELKLSVSDQYCAIIWETIVLLSGNPDKHALTIEVDSDRDPRIVELLQSHNATRIFYFYLHRATLRFLCGRIALAKKDIIVAKQYVVGGVASICEAGFYFYDSLIALATFSELETDREIVLKQVAENQEFLQLWARYAPMNYLHKWQLIEAEKYRVLGNKLEALEMYDRAISGAKDTNYLQEEGLANELAAKFYLAWDKQKLVVPYLQEAYYCYARWGAKVKTDELEKKYAKILTRIFQQFPKTPYQETMLGTITTTNSILDLASAVKTSQTLSQEIEFDALLAKFMKIILENAGADRGILILERSGVWEVGAQCVRDDFYLAKALLEETDLVPQSIVNTVKRTRDTLAIDNVAQDITFVKDSYFRQHSPKSLCCSPILIPSASSEENRGKLIGLLYLENSLTTATFSRERLEILNLLCAQAAISLENARLYGHLEDYNQNLEVQVTQRTRELQDKNQSLQQTLKELQQTQMQLIQAEKMSGLGQMVAGIAHEINNPINFIAGNIGHAREYFRDLLALIDLYEQNVPHMRIEEKMEEMNLEFLRGDLENLFKSIKTGSDRIHQIILGLRNFSRLDESDKKQVDIHEGLENTLLILQHRLSSREKHPAIAIVKSYGQLPLIYCHASQLNQVFLNILTNAIDVLQACSDRETPEICITTEMQDPDTARIAIIDNGSGMEENIRDRVFDPFFTTKPVGQGTGLGLSISYQIITEQHGGTLTCHSELGQGTVFAIAIPVGK